MKIAILGSSRKSKGNQLPCYLPHRHFISSWRNSRASPIAQVLLGTTELSKAGLLKVPLSIVFFMALDSKNTRLITIWLDHCAVCSLQTPQEEGNLFWTLKKKNLSFLGRRCCHRQMIIQLGAKYFIIGDQQLLLCPPPYLHLCLINAEWHETDFAWTLNFVVQNDNKEFLRANILRQSKR